MTFCHAHRLEKDLLAVDVNYHKDSQLCNMQKVFEALNPKPNVFITVQHSRLRALFRKDM